MTKQEFNAGIKEYITMNEEKPFSSDLKTLRNKFIQPILDKGSELFLAKNEKASWAGSFFQGDKVLSRIGIRENSIYREEEYTYSTEYLISKITDEEK